MDELVAFTEDLRDSVSGYAVGVSVERANKTVEFVVVDESGDSSAYIVTVRRF